MRRPGVRGFSRVTANRQREDRARGSGSRTKNSICTGTGMRVIRTHVGRKSRPRSLAPC